jgi:hypothetical protein
MARDLLLLQTRLRTRPLISGSTSQSQCSRTQLLLPSLTNLRDQAEVRCRINGRSCCAQQTGMYVHGLEATVLLSIYLSSELILIDTRVLSARCPLADAPGSACEAPPPATTFLRTWLTCIDPLPTTETRSPRNRSEYCPQQLRSLPCLCSERVNGPRPADCRQ